MVVSNQQNKSEKGNMFSVTYLVYVRKKNSLAICGFSKKNFLLKHLLKTHYQQIKIYIKKSYFEKSNWEVI